MGFCQRVTLFYFHIQGDSPSILNSLPSLFNKSVIQNSIFGIHKYAYLIGEMLKSKKEIIK